jgi:hypothetical protein
MLNMDLNSQRKKTVQSLPLSELSVQIGHIFGSRHGTIAMHHEIKSNLPDIFKLEQP